MNDDRFLEQARRDPSPEFARRLRDRLRATEDEAQPSSWLAPQLRGALVGVVAVLAAVVVFTVPSVRASAQAFLDLFRVRTFTAVGFDPSRIQRIEGQDVDLEELLGGQVETIKDSGPPRTVASPSAAGAATGLVPQEPSYVPNGFTLSETQVHDEMQARITVQSAKVDRLLDALDIRDARMPAGMDGKTAMVRLYPSVLLRYVKGEQMLTLVQAKSPEVELPAGVDLATLGELGLRILGLDRNEARRIAQSTDWHSTVLVPVPTNASSFSQVDVRGNRGLLIETSEHTGRDGKRRSGGTFLLWSDGNRVFALRGRISRVDLVQMASSLR